MRARLTRRSDAVTTPPSTTVAVIKGLNNSPSRSIEMPRWTRLVLTSKSTMRLVALPPRTSTGFAGSILIALLLALGKRTPGELVRVSTRPFLRVTDDLLGSSTIPNALYVLAGSEASPSVVVVPFRSANKLNDVFGVTSVTHPPAPPLSTFAATSALDAAAMRPSTRTTKMSTR